MAMAEYLGWRAEMKIMVQVTGPESTRNGEKIESDLAFSGDLRTL